MQSLFKYKKKEKRKNKILVEDALYIYYRKSHHQQHIGTAKDDM